MGILKKWGPTIALERYYDCSIAHAMFQLRVALAGLRRTQNQNRHELVVAGCEHVVSLARMLRAQNPDAELQVKPNKLLNDDELSITFGKLLRTDARLRRNKIPLPREIRPIDIAEANRLADELQKRTRTENQRRARFKRLYK